MEPEKHYLSREKLEELKTELATLKTTKRKEIAERLEFAKSLGDLSENAEYHAARDEQADTEDRISHLENILKHSEIISEQHGSEVVVGSTLVVKKDAGEPLELTIVGPEEVNPVTGKISYQSPLGATLIGKKAGQTIEVSTPKGKIQYKVVKIK